MNYLKVKDFLSHIVTSTKVVIEDDIIEDCVYFEGTVKGYLDSDTSLGNLTLIQSSIKNNALTVRVLKDYEQS